jgi:hypothetical protein
VASAVKYRPVIVRVPLLSSVTLLGETPVICGAAPYSCHEVELM